MVIAFRKNITWHVQLDAFIAQRSIISVWGPVEWVEDQLNGLGRVQTRPKFQQQNGNIKVLMEIILNLNQALNK